MYASEINDVRARETPTPRYESSVLVLRSEDSRQFLLAAAEAVEALVGEPPEHVGSLARREVPERIAELLRGTRSSTVNDGEWTATARQLFEDEIPGAVLGTALLQVDSMSSTIGILVLIHEEGFSWIRNGPDPALGCFSGFEDMPGLIASVLPKSGV